VGSGDPWDLEDDGLKTHEWTWFERKRETAIATDGGEPSDAKRTSSEHGSDDGSEEA